MTSLKIQLSLCAIALTTLPVIACSDAKPPIEAPASQNGDWCSWLQNKPATLYKNKDNPYIQEVSIGGRFQWQYGFVDGESAGRKFNYDTEEIRRFRLRAKIKFLQFFELSSSFDLENDLAPTGEESDHDIEYAGIYTATLSFDAQKAFNIKSLDSLEISIGKHKVISTGEYAISSRHIKTVERSAISNYTTPSSSTGLMVSIDKGRWDLDLGIFSGGVDPEFSEFDSSNDYFYTLRFGRSFENTPWFTKSRLDLRLTVNGNEADNSSSNADSPGAYDLDWVGSLAYTAEKDRFSLLADFIYGDNGEAFNKVGKARPAREGSFWGLVIMPSYYIVDNKLEAVFRYQYAHASEAQGIRMSSRYVRHAGNSANLPTVAEGRGDEHHSAYLGLNYYLCGDNTKVMIGVEYDELSSDGVDIYEGISAWAAFRMYF